MSLYHHFRDKDHILDEVAALVLNELRSTSPPDSDIVAWSLEKAKRYRTALLRHPNAIPLFVSRFPVHNRFDMYVQEFDALERVGIDRKYWIAILEALESFIIGSAMFLRGTDAPASPHSDVASERLVAEVIQARGIDHQRSFELAFVSLISALHKEYLEISVRP